MRAPGIATRIVCAVIGAVVAPLAVALIAKGGDAWAQAQMQYAYRGGGMPFDRLAVPTMLSALGIVLLVGVVLTGLFSAAGMIAAGIVGIAPVIGTAAPGAALALATTRLVPVSFLDPLFRGLPVAILPLLGFLGLALALSRRSAPRRGAASAVLGGIIAPVALALGGGLLMWGIQLGVVRAFQTFETRFQPLPAIFVLLGIALIAVGALATRWSTYALVVPAVLLLVLSVMNVLPPLMFTVPPRGVAQPTSAFLIAGGGVAVAIVQLTFTVVLAVRRARAGSADVSAASPVSTFPPAPTGAPPASPTPAPPAAPPTP